MSEIKIRDIHLTVSDNALTISSAKQPGKSISFDPSIVQGLVEFVHSLSSTPKSEPEGVNRRETFRVPVIADSGLTVRLLVKGRWVNVCPTDVSMNGVHVDLLDKEPAGIEIADVLPVAMTMGKDSVELQGVVRRREEQGVGLSFQAKAKSDQSNPPPVVRRIVMELQRRWMNHMKESSQES